jgi:hypothetical protein
MLKLLERKSGTERSMATSEGYFYLGQYYIGRGDKIKAREFFEKTRRMNLVVNTEYKAAGFELQYLGPPAEPLTHEASTAQGRPTGSLPAASTTAGDRPQRNVDPTASATPKTKKAPVKAPQSWTSGFWKLW